MSRPRPPATLRRLTKILYGAGDGGFSLILTLLGAYFAVFLTDVVGLAPGTAAAAIFVGRAWDCVNDPLLGHLTDRTRSRWGRRRPYILFGALPLAAAYLLLWWRPPLESQVSLAAYYAVAYLLFDTAATLVYMPYFALTPELTTDYDERTSLTSWRMLFSILGSLVAFPVPLAVIGSFRPENAARVFTVASTFAAVCVGGLLLTFLGTRERPEYLATPPPKLASSVKAALRNRPFLFGLAIYLFTWLAVDIVQAVLIYYVKYALRREAQSEILVGVIFVAAIPALALWGRLARIWDKRVAYIAGVAFWAAVQVILTLSVGPSTSLGVLVALCVLAGIGVGAAHVLPWSILPDAVEWDEWQTGERHEGMFYSLVTLAQKAASAASIPLVLLALEAAGYRAAVPEQAPAVVRAIRIVTGPIPAALLCLGILSALLYPLTRERYTQIARELEERRAGGRR